ncbi:MAG: extracellular solute-binding protein [Alphaproteobacteria bacterium]
MIIRNLIALVALALLAVFWLGRTQPSPTSSEEPYVNVYVWYGMIDEEIIHQFEKETGIKVRQDFFDNNNIVEAKLLSGHSGYDVVFPSASPYMKVQIEAGVYQPLDHSQLSNWESVDPLLLEEMRTVDPQNLFGVPYYWGTLGFVYVEEEILKRMPDAPVTSYRLLFDPDVVSRFSSCGVTLLEEAVDVYPQLLTFLGRDHDSSDEDDLEIAQEHLLKIRPFIQRFSSSRFVGDLIEGQTCLSQAWSGEVHAAQQRADEAGKNIRIVYVIPKEGSGLWIDAIGMPSDAPHPHNAHKFIDFLLRPEISALVSKHTKLGIANRHMGPHLDKELANNTTIYPSPEVMKKLHLDHPQTQNYERTRTRLWAQMRFANTPNT